MVHANQLRNQQKLVKAIDLYRGNSWSIIRKLQMDIQNLHGKKLRLRISFQPGVV